MNLVKKIENMTVVRKSGKYKAYTNDSIFILKYWVQYNAQNVKGRRCQNIFWETSALTKCKWLKNRLLLKVNKSLVNSPKDYISILKSQLENLKNDFRIKLYVLQSTLRKY